MAGSRFAGRRPPRSARRARAPGKGEPRAFRAFHPLPAEPPRPGRCDRPRCCGKRDRKSACRRGFVLSTAGPLLEIENLKVIFHDDRGRTTHAVDCTDLLGLSDREMCDMRGDRLAMIFQEPMTSLNPVYSIGEQIAETLVRHR